MIPVYDSHGEFHRHRVEVIATYWERGHIVTKYRVLVPDTTISGDYRYEYSLTLVPTQDF
jgi:hypothetical protein